MGQAGGTVMPSKRLWNSEAEGIQRNVLLASQRVYLGLKREAMGKPGVVSRVLLQNISPFEELPGSCKEGWSWLAIPQVSTGFIVMEGHEGGRVAGDHRVHNSARCSRLSLHTPVMMLTIVLQFKEFLFHTHFPFFCQEKMFVFNKELHIFNLSLI